MAALDDLDGHRALAALFEAVNEHQETGVTPLWPEETILTLNISLLDRWNEAVQRQNFLSGF
jgi:hypothetical protein